MSWLIFGIAVAVYAVFWSWYVGFGGKMSSEAIEGVMKRLAGAGEMTPERLAWVVAPLGNAHVGLHES